MMHSRYRSTLAWSLAVLFGLISGLGDALHLVPGLNHPINLPGGSLSVDLTSSSRFVRLGRQGPAIKTADEDGPPVVDANRCPICEHFSQGSAPAELVAWVCTLPQAEGAPAVIRPVLHLTPSQPFLVRGPPSV